MELQSRPEALAVELSRHQALGHITAVPVTGPQVSSLQRLAGQGAAVLPQVRPKTLIPDSLPVTPGRDRPPKQTPTFQKATVVSIKNPSPALPTANNTVNHVPTPSSQPQALAEPTAITSPLSSAGVAYAIISTSPSNAAAITPSTTVPVANDSIKVQPLLISADSKVIIIQPQVQTQPESSAEPQPPTEEPSQGAQATKKKEDWTPSQENPEKIAFMVALGLVTTEHLEEIQSKRQERKRRSTANPTYSSFLETERKRLASSYLNNPLFLTARANEDPCWKSEITHDEHCAACKRGANLQPCSTCPGAYHLSCLDPPLKTAPKGLWVCPKCQQKALKKHEGVPWTGMLAIVHSYVTHKTVKEEEKQKLLQRGSELQTEHQQLEERDQQLASAVKKCLELKTSLLARQRGTQSSLDRLRALLRLIQGDQMLQVAMAATSSTPLLTGPWSKPSTATMRPALQHPQGHN
ncbi:PHD finger protein 21B isoform X3 [Nannospalax galili]|uniref:PHD finger protein 21B isoform X3 n=1 Tax=Nannospalax galili TaxID=1026970 RepID=UPI0004ED4F30|nr:PHD finger protein 21B isoform X3 [Nannospalax galili]